MYFNISETNVVMQTTFGVHITRMRYHKMDKYQPYSKTNAEDMRDNAKYPSN